MQIFNSYPEYAGSSPTAITMGMFDGVHLGHQRIIQEVVTTARQKDLETVMLTYWPHPRLFFNPNEKLKLLTTKEERIKYFEALGIRTVIFQPFDKEFSALSGKDFVKEVLAEKLKAKYLLVGYDHTFGSHRSGNFALLQQLSAQYNYTVQQANAVELQGQAVSSTAIRNLLGEGLVREAAKLLGRPYELSGEVIQGKQLGRTLGFPTANLKVPTEKILPKEGAYIVEAWVGEKAYPAMASIGNNPTVNGETISVEVYLTGFSGNLYGQTIAVRFLEWLHPQIKFESLEGLVDQLKNDEAETIAFFS